MFSDPCHRCALVIKEVSQMTEKMSPLLSHVHSCDTGHWTCENFILWYIGGVILPQTHLMQQTTTNATIIRWRNAPFWRPSSLRRSKLVSFYCHKIYSWELCALSTGFYSKEKSVLWQKKRDHPQIASVHFPVPVPSTSIENLSKTYNDTFVH